MVKFLGIFLSIFLAFISYRFIENPFRYKFSLKSTLMLIVSSIAICLVSYSFFITNKTETLGSKLSESVGTNYRCQLSDYFLYGSSRACSLGKPDDSFSIALLGNSHAQMYAPIFNKSLTEKNISGVLIPLNGCLPTSNINTWSGCSTTAKINATEVLNDSRISVVFIGTTWYLDKKYWTSNVEVIKNSKKFLELFLEDLILLIDELKASGKRVVVIGPIQLPEFSVADRLSRQLKFGYIDEKTALKELKSPVSSYHHQFKEINNQLRAYLGEDFLEPYLDLCDKDSCYYGDKKGAYFSDDNHLSSYGVSKLISFKESLISILKHTNEKKITEP